LIGREYSGSFAGERIEARRGRVLDGTESRELTVISRGETAVPSIVAAHGEQACRRFLEFFVVSIRNANIRDACLRNALAFVRWRDTRGIVGLKDVESMHVAAYVEELANKRSAPTAKQHLATLRMLFDWLVTGQVIPWNPPMRCEVRGIR
jgi:hypothetical protein